MRTAILTSMSIALSLLLAGVAHAQVRLAVAGPVTGPNASFGAQLTQGVEQAVEDINKAGGILGQKIQVEVGDDVSDPKQGVSVANKFVGDGVRFVVGHFNSGVTMPASDVYAENGILFITPSATNPKITDRKLWDAFRTCGRDDQQGLVWAELARDKLKGKRIVVIHDKTTYGKGLADAALENMHKFGVKEVLYEGVNTGEKDYSAIVSKIKDANADYLMWGGLHTEGGLILRQMRDQGMKTDRRSWRRRNADDLRPRAAQQPQCERRRRFVQGQGVRPARLHALFLCRRPDPEAGGREGEVARSEEGCGRHAFRHALPHRHRRHLL
jgi:branched-chain amino acid transport system substrate-binding protein